MIATLPFEEKILARGELASTNEAQVEAGGIPEGLAAQPPRWLFEIVGVPQHSDLEPDRSVANEIKALRQVPRDFGNNW